MLQHLELLTRFVASALEPAVSNGLWQLALLAAVGIAGAAIVSSSRTAVLLAAITLGVPRRHPVTEPLDVSRLLSQSDPDADGKPRPRAPGLRAATAVL